MNKEVGRGVMKGVAKFSVSHINVLSDNFSYILRDASSRNCLVVDVSGSSSCVVGV
jgi:hypothetical protein